MEPCNADRRFISGNRVIARCVMELPKVDLYTNFRNRKSAFLVFNVRGGSIYLFEQLNKHSLTGIFPNDRPVKLTNLTLYPREQPEIKLSEISMRFDHIREDAYEKGIVFRFVSLTEKNMDSLNAITLLLPPITANEGKTVSISRTILKQENRI